METHYGTAMAGDYVDVAIDEVIIGERLRKAMGDIAGLAESIRVGGVLAPVLIARDRRLVCGARRLEAARQAGLERVPARIVDLADPRRAEIDENVCRLPYSPLERVGAHQPWPEEGPIMDDVDVLDETELAGIGVEVVDRNGVVLRCRDCEVAWSPNLEPGGALPELFRRCPNGCNAEAAEALESIAVD